MSAPNDPGTARVRALCEAINPGFLAEYERRRTQYEQEIDEMGEEAWLEAHADTRTVET